MTAFWIPTLKNSWLLKDKYFLNCIRLSHSSSQGNLKKLMAFCLCKPLSLFSRNTLLELPDSVSPELQFLKLQISSFLTCSLLCCFVVGITWCQKQDTGCRPAQALTDSDTALDSSQVPRRARWAFHLLGDPRSWWWVFLYLSHPPWEKF